MILYILAYLGGAITIASPCILPVLPFVFARANRPFLTNGLPMLIGMAVMFMGIATLAAVGGSWAVSANQYGRYAALALLALFGLALLFPEISDRLTRPLVGFGAKLSNKADAQDKGGVGASLVLGVATGLLWAPCAGPILGLVLTGAALQGANIGTTVLLLCYALGAATSLALALLVGGRVFKAMKQSLGIGEWIRRAIGALVLVAVAVIALGLDTGFLSQASLSGTNRAEQFLLDRFGMSQVASAGDKTLEDQGPMPPLAGAVEWINSPPLTAEQLKGKVVLVDFWTYSCINCIRTMPYLRAWDAKYRKDGLVIVGIHTPEFAFEKDPANVRKAVKDLGITYPVAMDNNYKVWQAFQNRYWPAHYFVDAKGRIRYHHFAEGGYADSERVIQRLLAEANPKLKFDGISAIAGQGVEETYSSIHVSPETYVGYARAKRFTGMPAQVHDKAADYAASPAKLDDWGLAGSWIVGREAASSGAPGARILYRFNARDLHLVLGPTAGGRSVRFRVTIDGQAPGDNHGVDTDAAGNGTIGSQRLYQLVRLKGGAGEHLFTIEFLDPGAQAFSFTFG